MRQKYFINTFGVAGDITPAIPDAADTNGFVSYDIGFSFDYQRLLGTDPLAKPILRTNLNAILSDVTGAVQGLQQQGVPEFITAAQNGGTAYPYRLRALVAYSTAGTPPFQVYQNLVDSNTAVPGTDATWVLVKPEDYPLLDGTNTFTGTNTFNQAVIIPAGTTANEAVNFSQLQWQAGNVTGISGASIISGVLTIPAAVTQEWTAGPVSALSGATISGGRLTINFPSTSQEWTAGNVSSLSGASIISDVLTIPPQKWTAAPVSSVSGASIVSGVLTIPAGLTAASFPSSLSANGYKKYPDPNSPTGFFIEQWGTFASSSWAGINGGTVTFPISYPTACLDASICEGAAGTWTTGNATVYCPSAPTKTGFTLLGLFFNGTIFVGPPTGTFGVRWQSKGY